MTAGDGAGRGGGTWGGGFGPGSGPDTPPFDPYPSPSPPSFLPLCPAAHAQVHALLPPQLEAVARGSEGASGKAWQLSAWHEGDQQHQQAECAAYLYVCNKA